MKFEITIMDEDYMYKKSWLLKDEKSARKNLQLWMLRIFRFAPQEGTMFLAIEHEVKAPHSKKLEYSKHSEARAAAYKYLEGVFGLYL